MGKSIYILNACDQWKSISSMSKICVTTDFSEILDVIRNNIKVNDMLYKSDNDEESYALLNIDISQMSRSGMSDEEIAHEINKYLECGYLEVWEDNLRRQYK